MKELAERRNGIQYFDVAQGYAHIELGKCILEYLQDVEIEQYTPIILCIGTDRATGDCLGPLVGEQLLNYSEIFHVMGCLSAPVHALNIRDALHDIQSNYENPFVIAVDASLGSSSHVGLVTINDGPILPGKGVKEIAGNRRSLHYRHCKRVWWTSGSSAIHPSVHCHAARRLHCERTQIFDSLSGRFLTFIDRDCL